MKEFTSGLNARRIKALAYFALTALLFVCCGIAVIFTVSENVHLEAWITLIAAAVFAFAAVLSRIFLYSPSRRDYEDDFKENALKELFYAHAENVKYTSGKTDTSRFASQNVMSGFEDGDAVMEFDGTYENIPFSAVFAKNENGFTGWLMEFEFSKIFKRNIHICRKGSSLVVPPEKVWEDGHTLYETASEPFNFKYVVASADGVDASAVMCEEAVYAFLSATERTRARISASLDGNKMYLFLYGVAPSFNIPLVSPVTETKLRKELFADISAALTLALDLDTEKKIWKRI